MKKIIILLLLILLSSYGLTSYAEVKTPEWSDFSPPKYLNAQYDNNTYYSYGAKEVFLALSIIGIPRNIHNWHKYLNQQENNYWANKRVSFERNKSICELQSDTNSRNICYLKLVDMFDNQIYSDKVAAETAKREQIFNATNNMQRNMQLQNINNNLNSINNNINGINH